MMSESSSGAVSLPSLPLTLIEYNRPKNTSQKTLNTLLNYATNDLAYRLRKSAKAGKTPKLLLREMFWGEVKFDCDLRVSSEMKGLYIPRKL
jgi:hypothetical protein